jgi:ribokinase
MGKILVVGSSNTDMVLKTTRFPEPGETILGGEFFTFQGGKGANQAVAAARLGGDVGFACKLGDDAFGKTALAHYDGEGIDVSYISLSGEAPTGVAMITVNQEGENSIIVASGANLLLAVNDVKTAVESSSAYWLITQLETPLQVVEYLAGFAREHDRKLILNPAPALDLPVSVYDRLFLITPNENEAERLTGIPVVDEASARLAAAEFKLKGVQNVIITLGSRGAFVDSLGYQGIVESYPVKAVDTTAAGDVFNGALAVALSENQAWKEAVQFACRAAAYSVTKMGAQTSAPTRAAMERWIL